MERRLSSGKGNKGKGMSRPMVAAATALAASSLLVLGGVGELGTNLNPLGRRGLDGLLSASRRALRYAPASSARGRSKGGRTLVSYTSSAWEKEWLANVDRWQAERSICDVLLGEGHWPKVMRFLEATCTHYSAIPADSPWCKIDEGFMAFFYHRGTGEMSANQPDGVEFEKEARPLEITADYDDIFSKFTYRDDATGNTYDEYIEPLVSHLRHPVAGCKKELPIGGILTRSYILAPPPSVRSSVRNAHSATSEKEAEAEAKNEKKRRVLYFDAGASAWDTGAGGPSLSVFAELYGRSGFGLDEIYAFEASTDPQDFMAQVPPEYKNRMHYRRAYVRSSPTVPSTDDPDLDGPFLPAFIREKTTEDDYAIFKLDIDSPKVEEGTIRYLLSPEGAEDLAHIDELIWEHHVSGNYIMMEAAWKNTPSATADGESVSIRQSAEYFRRLREKGVRAHSYV